MADILTDPYLWSDRPISDDMAVLTPWTPNDPPADGHPDDDGSE